MQREQRKLKERKMTQFLLLGIFSFSMAVALLDSIHIQPNVTSASFYFLLLIVIAMVYKPVRLYVLRSVASISRFLFSGVKSFCIFCTSAISFRSNK
ncbi:hypothetical protein D1B33_13655 [Lysinibacillus yapensis]|uniref:Uncharacterized protein n=1 Tax=Ureibacillus yapensis TaxID=2304605 RepID=A0A396SJX6_9BACL|nr:hypothetical protein [Lysinibacillus yapensis]RHW34691.1 hypothetical protein D1B33_13655 [Lysinibacillus yapensis]